MNRLKRIQSFCYEWPGTKQNHAGMAYFSRRLRTDLNLPFSCFFNSPENQKSINLAQYYVRLASSLMGCLFFMEYLTPIGKANQENLAINLKQRGIKIPAVGLVHLPERLLLKYWDMEHIRAALEAVDHVVVYGSSLAEFFRRIGFGDKVKQTFHYVDTEYYRPLEMKSENNGKFNIVVVGSLLRNVKKIKEIVQACPDINFQICGGIKDLRSEFQDQLNVQLSGYLPENELLVKIQNADASLSVMDDTIGSNAIVSALACGLPQIVSDVGSIRDYCSEENSVFCRDLKDYVDALNSLNKDREMCFRMGKNARERAEELSLPRSIEWFRNLFMKICQENEIHAH